MPTLDWSDDRDTFTIELDGGDEETVMRRFISRIPSGTGRWDVHSLEAATIADGSFEMTEEAERRLEKFEATIDVVRRLRMIEPYHKFEDIDGFKSTLFVDQHNAVYALWKFKGFTLAEPVGKGKTIATVAASCLHVKEGRRIIVIVEASKVRDWTEEYTAHSDLSVIACRKSWGPKERKSMFSEWTEDGPDVLIMSYEKAAIEHERISQETRFRPTAIFLDETGKIKNFDSSLHKNICKIGRACTHRYGLNASVFETALDDCYSVLRFQFPGKYDDYGKFQDRYCVMDPRWGGVREFKNEREFKRRMYPLFISRKGKDIDVARGAASKVSVHVAVKVETSRGARSAIRGIRAERERIMEAIGEFPDGMAPANLTNKMKHLGTRELRVLISPRLEGMRDEENGKLTALFEIVSDMRSRGRRGIVFSRWEDTIDWIASTKPDFTWIDGRGGPDLVKRLDEFKTGNHDVLLATDAVKRGHNLGMCDYVVHMDMLKSALHFEQRNGRIDRKSEDRRLMYFYLLCRDSRDVDVFNDMLKKLRTQKKLYGNVDDVPAIRWTDDVREAVDWANGTK